MGIRHVLLEVSAEGDVDQLPTTTHGEERNPRVERPAGDGEIEGVLLVVDVVDAGVSDLVAVQRGREVSPAGQQDAVGERRGGAPISVGRTMPSGAHGWTASGSPPARSTPADRVARRGQGAVAMGRGGGREPSPVRRSAVCLPPLTPLGRGHNVCIRTISHGGPMSTASVAGVDVDTRHWIGGERVASAETFDDVSPIDGQVIAQVSRGGAAEVRRRGRCGDSPRSRAGPALPRPSGPPSCTGSPTASRSGSRTSPRSRPATTARCSAPTAVASCRGWR